MLLLVRHPVPDVAVYSERPYWFHNRPVGVDVYYYMFFFKRGLQEYLTKDNSLTVSLVLLTTMSGNHSPPSGPHARMPTWAIKQYF